MKPRTLGALAFLAIFVTFVGCISEREQSELNKQLAEAFAAPLNNLAAQLAGGQDIGYATVAFQRKNGRWPTNQTELTNFVAKSEGYLVMRDYDSVNFSNQPDGRVRVAFVPHDRTNEHHLTISTNLQSSAATSFDTPSTSSRAETATLLSSLLSPDWNQTTVPEKFSTYVGGFLGPKYNVELRNGMLYYSATNSHGKKEFTKIKPSSKDWQKFRQSLDQIGIWHWQTNYDNRNVLDGTQWRIEVRYKDHMLTAKGSNSFPQRDGTPNNEPEITQSFKDYCAAVTALTSGKKFE